MLKGIEHYEGREQSWVKHYVLSKYLERFGQIIGSHWSSITYVDGFSGPWNAKSKDLSDTSFSIALVELRKAQETHKNLTIRCVFCEPKKSRFNKLSEFAAQATDKTIKIKLLRMEFEEAISDILEFINEDRNTFTFSFIDPTGWTGFSMEKIVPLLGLSHSEVMITLMTEFIRRFWGNAASRESFKRLCGVSEFPEHINRLSGIDRDDEIAEFYRKCLKTRGLFDHVQRFIVIHPSKARNHFELMYGTRHAKGIEVFKDAEKNATKAQEEVRANLEIQRTNQTLFFAEDLGESAYFSELRSRYLGKSRDYVRMLLSSQQSVPYDRLWLQAMHFPMVWEDDLRSLLKKWRDQGIVRWTGMGPRERTLKRDAGHVIERIADLPAE